MTGEKPTRYVSPKRGGKPKASSARRLLRGFYDFLIGTAQLFAFMTLVVAPIVIKLSVSSNPEAIVRVDGSEVPTEAVRAVETISPALTSLGFEHVLWMRTDMTPGSVVFGALLLHSSREHAFTALHAYDAKEEDLGPVLIHTKSYGEFVGELVDDREVRTSNLAWSKSFEPEPWLIEHRHPQLAGRLEDLFNRHRGHVAGPGVALLPYPEDIDWVAEVKESARRSMDVQVEEGLMKRGDDGVYRLTWKGAYVMTWRQVF